MLELLQNNLPLFLMVAVALVIALSIHEAMHAYAAKVLGDDTADLMGRLTLNPLAHLDPFGTLAILLFGFGWGRPVPVNPLNFHDPRLDNLKVALAGPASNVALAVVFALFYRVFQPDPGSMAGQFSQIIVQLNLMLAFFNLIPVPPLDGSKILHLFLSDEVVNMLEQYGFIILMGLLFFGQPLISAFIGTPTDYFLKLLLG